LKKPIELGRIIRGEIEEIWTLVIDDGGLAAIRYETLQVAGDGRNVSYLSPKALYASNAPRPIKDRMLKRELFA
jgi:hypothetical protein